MAKFNRDGNQQRVGDLLKFVFTDPRHHTKIHEARLRLDWEKIMGPMIARYTTKLHLNGARLTLYISSASLKNELTFAKEKLIQRLNEALGEEIVKDVRFL